MPAERIKLDCLLSDSNALESRERLCSHLLEGAICVYPTETVYGIGGRADSLDVKNKILAAKKRSPENPMILIAANRHMFNSCDVVFPAAAEKLAARFWPGYLTLVLPSPHDAALFTGVRVSSHWCIELFAPINIPLFSTSANVSGEPYNSNRNAIYETFKDSVDIFIDAGELPPSPPSTVVRVSPENRVEIIREGAIFKQDIFGALE